MSEQNHVHTANRLRFSLAIASAIVIGITIIGLQRMRQWKVDEEAKAQQEEYERVTFQRKSQVQQPEEQESAPRPVIASKKRATTPVAVISPNGNRIPTNDPPIIGVESAPNTPPSIPTASAVAGVPRGTRTIGSIMGNVVLKGTPPPEKVIPMDAVCGNLHQGPVKTRLYLIGTNNGLANTFVYIKEGLAKGRKYQMAGEELLLDQTGCLYEPYVSGVRVGQKLKIRNSDPVLHNVHTTPTLHPDLEFNFGQPVQGQVTEKRFLKPEIMLRFKCDVHPWMFAYVGVVEHPFFAVTDA
ncbi:MAG: hypothetical protein JWM68_180, partial [Verrucomicrobiales bacterium]|nr:hypothetical protein [Verrucomicrobiales bacterium]